MDLNFYGSDVPPPSTQPSGEPTDFIIGHLFEIRPFTYFPNGRVRSILLENRSFKQLGYLYHKFHLSIWDDDNDLHTWKLGNQYKISNFKLKLNSKPYIIPGFYPHYIIITNQTSVVEIDN